MYVFSVYDCKAEAYLPPIFFKTKGLAIRAFEAAANAPDHDFNRYAADYTLFLIGAFDEDSGRVIMLDALENMGNALAYRQDGPEATPVMPLSEATGSETHGGPRQPNGQDNKSKEGTR